MKRFFKTALLECIVLAVAGLLVTELTAQEANSEEELEGYGRWTKSQVRMQLRQIEFQDKVEEWADKNEVKRTDFLERYYQPVVDGNRKSYENNMRMAKKLRDMAEQARTKGQDERAAKYNRAGKLYYQSAQQNKAIVQAITNEQDNQMLQDAFNELQDLEKQIAQLTGRWPKRQWFIPRELVKTRARMRARQVK